jgi:photosystem II stability/assembly factor-like uncharacterized protein
VTRIEDLFAHAVEQAEAQAPPSRLSAPYAYSQGRRRRSLLISAVTAAALAVGGATAGTAAGSRLEEANPVPQAVSDFSGNVVWAGAGDRDHLYALRTRCAPPTRPCTTGPLLGSTDGGRTWTERRTPAGPGIFTDASVLGVSIVRMTGPGGDVISVDGGWHWSATASDPHPFSAVPDAAEAVGWTASSGETRVAAVNPATGAIRALEVQPPLMAISVRPIPADLGIWVTGLDWITHRPAVSVSRDRGQTWTTALLPDLPSVTWPDPSAVATLDTADGRVAYVQAEINGPGPTEQAVFRTADGGATWVRVDPTGRLRHGFKVSFVARDNRHVAIGDPSPSATYVSSVDAGPYEDLSLPLPASAAAAIRVMRGGGYLTSSPDAIYVSDNGLAWRCVWPG